MGRELGWPKRMVVEATRLRRSSLPVTLAWSGETENHWGPGGSNPWPLLVVHGFLTVTLTVEGLYLPIVLRSVTRDASVASAAKHPLEDPFGWCRELLWT